METEARNELAELVRWVYAQGWSPGTGGNYSTLLNSEPFRLLITPTGADKGAVQPDDLLIVDDAGRVIEGSGSPSAESLLHVAIIQELGANTVLHSHSIWNTLASLSQGDNYELQGLEMLKGLDGVTTHEHREAVPILENSQDIPALSQQLRQTLRARQNPHGFLLRGHGLYTWGHNRFEARRHLEIFEFLFELTVRRSRIE